MYNAYSTIQSTAQHVYERISGHMHAEAAASLSGDREAEAAIGRVLRYYREAFPALYAEVSANVYEHAAGI